jgi:hypothetical protein
MGISTETGIALHDVDGKTRLVLSVDEQGEPELVVRDRQHRTKSFRPKELNRSFMPLLIVIGICALLAGCVKDAVILVHPQSGKEAQCGPYYFTGMSSGIFSKAAADERERDCIAEYQQQGYERK